MKKGLLRLFTAILMTMAVLVIMTNSPPASSSSASVNTGLNSSMPVTVVSLNDGTYVANAILQPSLNSSSMATIMPLRLELGVKMEKNSTGIIFETAPVVSSVTMSEVQEVAMVSSISLKRMPAREVTAAKKKVTDSIVIPAPCSSIG